MNLGTVCLGGVFLALEGGLPKWIVCRVDLEGEAVQRAARFWGTPLIAGPWEKHRPGLIRCRVQRDLTWS